MQLWNSFLYFLFDFLKRRLVVGAVLYCYTLYHTYIIIQINLFREYKVVAQTGTRGRGSFENFAEVGEYISVLIKKKTFDWFIQSNVSS